MGDRGRQVGWTCPSDGLPRATSPFPHPLSCQRRSPRRAPMGDTTQLPNTAPQGLKMQHPKQGLKMQSRGGPVREGWCPNHRGCQSGILPLPSAVPGGRSDWRDPGEQRRRAPHLPGTSAPSPCPHPRAPRSRGRGLQAPAGPGRGGRAALTFVTVMQKLRGGAGARARRAGAAAGVHRGPQRWREAVGRGAGSSGRAPRSPRPAGGSAEPGAALRAGSAQGPLVGARPPLAADVSPECAFIIDEPPSPQEGEAGRKGEGERAQAGGRGEEEGPGTRYKGGGGGRRRRRRKRTPARCPALRLGLASPPPDTAAPGAPARRPGPRP